MPNDLIGFEEWASQPFQPKRLHREAEMDIGERVVEALEYIAAQLGEICRKMDHVTHAEPSSPANIEAMKELLRKL